MVKLLRHKWRNASENSYDKFFVCERCGCVRYWDFTYDHAMYKWGTHITYTAPPCLLPNTLNYDNKII